MIESERGGLRAHNQEEKSMDIKFEPVGLTNLGGPEVAARFDATLEALVESMRDPDAAASGGVVKGRISLVVDVEYVRDSDRVNLFAKVEAKHPPTKSVMIPVTQRGGKLLAEIVPNTQARLPFAVEEGGAE